MKRVFDIAASFFGLICFGWLILLLAAMIRRDTPAVSYTHLTLPTTPYV